MKRETVILANGYEGYQWTQWKTLGLCGRFSIDEDSTVEVTDKNTKIPFKSARTSRDELTSVLLPAFKKLEQSSYNDWKRLLYCINY